AWWPTADLSKMLLYLRHPSDRKYRLFGCACCRRRWSVLIEVERQLVVLAEQCADGLLSRDDLDPVRELVNSPDRVPSATASLAWPSVHRGASAAADSVAWAVGWSAADAAGLRRGDPRVQQSPTFENAFRAERDAQAALLRHIIGNPFRPYSAPPHWPA